MNVLDAGQRISETDRRRAAGGCLTLWHPAGEFDWQVWLLYTAGWHCRLQTYLKTLDGLGRGPLIRPGVDVVPCRATRKTSARRWRKSKDLSLTVGYDLSIAQMQDLGLLFLTTQARQEN